MRRWTAVAAKTSVASLLLGWAITTHGQDWPKLRPITIVTVGTGSSADILARLIGAKIGESIGQVALVENRPGAAGNIAAQRVKRAVADGYTILLASNAFVVNPSLYASAGYDPIKEFSPIILVASSPSLISVHPSVPAANLHELIELARKRPLTYASAGTGTTSHLSMERLKTAAKIDLTHVPYPQGKAIIGALAGEVQVLSSGLPQAVPHIKAGKLRPIAVASANRSPTLPDVPSVSESGYRGFDDLIWWGFFAPAGTSAEIVNRLNGEVIRAFELLDVKEKLGQLGLDSRRNTPVEFADFVRVEVPKWAQAVKDTGAKVD